MRPSPLVPLILATAVIATAHHRPAAAQETILQNDGFMDGQAVSFQGGFVDGEIAASRLLPTGTPPWRVNRVRFLFGGSNATATMTLRIWDDLAGTLVPGTELFFRDYSVTGSDVLMQEIDLTADNVHVTGQFRVGIEFHHDGAPSVARDTDGTILSTRNFIYAFDGNWYQSSTFGVIGDWIIRAGIEPVTVGVEDVGPGSLALAAVGPNPSSDGRLRLWVTLPTSAPARVDLLDVSGRRMARRELGALGAGRHTVELVAEGRLASGVYLVRLNQGGDARMIRIVMTR